MAQPMPESVKSTRVGVPGIQAAKKGFKFPCLIAPDEVMILLAIDYWWHSILAVGNNVMQFGIWRKSDADCPSSIFASGGSPDMIFSRVEKTLHVAESIKQGDRDFITLPWPMVLIRPPRLMVETAVMTSFVLDMRLWYLLRNVNDVDLAKLMVKDHA